MEKKPIRVLHVIGIMNRGGAENMIMNLYRKIDKTKVQFDFVENSFETAAFDQEILDLGGRIYRCPHFTGFNLIQYRNWWINFFKKRRNDYVIVHGHLGSTAAIYLSIAKQNNIYTIAHSHSSGTDNSFKSYLYKVISYPTRYIADYFFACSNVAGIDRYGKKVVSGPNYHILNNAIDTARFKFDHETRKKIRKEFNISEDVYVIGHIGRYTREKNHEFLIRLFKKIHDRRPDTILLLVGDGPLHKSMELLVNELDLNHSVIFTGVRGDVNCLLQGMDLFILPSLYEGLPVTMIEAQTSGLKSIISNAVPKETIITINLVDVCNLEDSMETWVKHISDILTHDRTDTIQSIIDHGYDIETTASWLEDFYIARSR